VVTPPVRFGESEVGETGFGEREFRGRAVGKGYFGKLEVGERESGDFDGRVRVPCTKGNYGTHRTLPWTLDQEMKCHISSEGWRVCVPQENQQDSAKTSDSGWKLWV